LNPYRRRTWIAAVCFFATTAFAWGQAASPEALSGSKLGSPESSTLDQSTHNSPVPSPPDAPQPNTPENKILNLPAALLHDQIGLWTSPSKARFSDTTWLVPLGGLTAALFATDNDFSRHLSKDPNAISNYRRISDYGAYSMAAGAAGLYFLGLTTHNEHQRETGFLSGEAAVDSLAIVEALKLATGRQRPYQGSGIGQFWSGGASFPSEHATVWSIAGIVAHEYPDPFTKFLSYGLASTVSAFRITAKEHFPSDVLIGAAIGYLTSEYVYRKHHNPEVPGGTWDFPVIRPDHPHFWNPHSMGSPYVPLDRWIYPALERLAALGYIDSAIAGMRPWTRIECARQVSEVADRIGDESEGDEAALLYRDLTLEFRHELEMLGGGDNAELRLESAYTRGTNITGKPLTDSYHFGQTIVNDRGRPEEQGFNLVSGLSGWVANGPFAIYFDGEYQHSPGAPSLPLAAREAITIADFGRSLVPQPWPMLPGIAAPSISRARLLDTYVAMNLSDWQLSYGKQSLKWGPDEGGGVMLSENIDPLTMFRVDRVTPFQLPGFLRYLGPMRVEFFVGEHSGYEFMFAPSRACVTAPCLVGAYGESLNPQPITHGERFSFKPMSNFEFGMSRTTDYGGPGYPLTWHTFLRSVFSTALPTPGALNKPGSHRSGVDFSYRIRNELTFYADGMTEHDSISPIIDPDVAAWLGGIYIPRLPKLPKMDFRAEGVYTDPPIGGNVGSGYFYYNPTWISGFTNSGALMGHWVGREGQGVQAWTTYWFTPRNKVQFEFRHLKVSHEFIPNGGTLADGSVRAEFWVRSNFSMSATVQYEQWTFPVLSPTKQSNVASSLQFTFWPKGLSRKGSSAQ
jgi:capsule assembly protein Wzi/PAP2 superfamily protein